MAGTMRAQRFYKATREWAVEDVPIPEPGPGEVLIKVAYCGICHSDLSLIDGIFGGPDVPDVITQGHEASGTIVFSFASVRSGRSVGLTRGASSRLFDGMKESSSRTMRSACSSESAAKWATPEV